MFGEREVAFVLKLPKEGAEFARNGDNGFVFIELSCLQSFVAEMEPVLGAPGEGFDFRVLSFLSFAQGGADVGWSPIMLRALDKHPARMTIAAFCDGALASFGAAGLFVRNEPEVGHELLGVRETTKVAEFADECHGGHLLKAFEAHERTDGGFPFPVGEDLLHLVGETGDALNAGVDGEKVFFEDNFLGRVLDLEFAKVSHMGFAPVGVASVSETVAQEKGFETLFGANQVVSSIGARACDITDGLIARRWHADRDEIPVAKLLRNFDGITLVGFNAFAGFACGLGGSQDNDFESEAYEVPGENEAGRSGFVTELEVFEGKLELLREFTKGVFDIDERALAGAVVDGVLTRVAESVCDGDRILVDIESNVVVIIHGAFRYSKNVG